MDLWTRWRADLARPEAPTGRDHLPFLAGSAAVIVVVAQLTDPGTIGELAVLAAAYAAFVVRGLVPNLRSEIFVAAVVVPVIVAIGGDGHLEVAFFLLVMATLYAAWFLRSWTRAALIAGLLAAVPWVVAHTLAPGEGIGWTAWSSANLFTFSMGRVLRRQEDLIAELERARGALAEQAVAEERRRIARELHDLAGHTLAAMMLHVTGARHVLRRDVDEAERALLDAETVGRSSLDQIRATVAALRTDERGTDPALAGSADLAALVEEYRRAGLAVTTSFPPSASELGGPVGTALHRIVRESLANVARHAPANRVAVALDGDGDAGDEIRLVVADHGTPAADPASGHFGIVGMRERARALGGDLDAGPTADGWRVEARLPAGMAVRAEPAPLVIRVLIVDDQAVVRAGVARILGPDDGFEVVAECDDGDEVAAAVAQHHPEVVLMDIRMRRLDGVEATRRLRAEADEPAVLVLTTFDDDDVLWGALDAGAAGFVLKDASAEDLIAATRAVAGGAAWLDPKVAARVLGAARDGTRARSADSTRLEELTEREHDVLRHMARGATNAEIATALIVGEATVKSHVGAIFSKLGVRDRPAAIVFAYDHGIVGPLPRGDAERRP